MQLLQDFATLQNAKDYVDTKTVRIEGSTRKTAVETVNIFNDTETRLENFVPNSALTAEQQEQAVRLARMIVKALKNLFNPEFYIQLENPEVQAAYAGAVALGVLTQVEYDGILAAGTSVTTPYINATEHSFAVAKNDPTRFAEILNGTIDKDFLRVVFNPSTNPDFESHIPSVYTLVHGEKRRLNSFEKPITTDGVYYVFVNKNRGLFYVDDVYGVVDTQIV